MHRSIAGIVGILIFAAALALAAPPTELSAPLPQDFDGKKFVALTGADMSQFYARGGRLYWDASLGPQDLTLCVQTAAEKTAALARAKLAGVSRGDVRQALLEIHAALTLAVPGGHNGVAAVCTTLCAIVQAQQ